jgi:hypothetical protein
MPGSITDYLGLGSGEELYFFFTVLGLELRAYVLSYSTSLFL